MSEENQVTEVATAGENLIPTDSAAPAKATKSATLPKSIADIQAITHVPTTEATKSFGAFVNKYLTNADNFTPVTEEQAWAVIGIHRVWQQSDERKAEKEALVAAGLQEAEAKKAAAAEKKALKEAEAKAKAEAKARKDAEKAAKAAAEGEGVDALESLDTITEEVVEELPGDGEAVEGVEVDAPAAEEGGKKNRQRRPRPGQAGF